MINVRLLQIVEENIADFKSDNSNDLIKAEKILKAESKINPDITIKEIEKFVAFFKTNGAKFNSFLATPQIQAILLCDVAKFETTLESSDLYPENRFANESVYYETAEEDTENEYYSINDEFGDLFSDAIGTFIQINISAGNWINLRSLFQEYESIISFENFEKAKVQLTSKNDLIRSILPYREKYKHFLKEYAFSIDDDFYKLQSDIDSYYFEDQISDINSDIVEYQHVEGIHKVYLGKVLAALCSFEAFSEEIAETLEGNLEIAKGWIRNESKFLDRVSGISGKMASKNCSAIAEWILMIVYFSLLVFGGYCLFQFSVGLFATVALFEIVLYFIYRKRIHIGYDNNFDSVEENIFRKRLKRITLESFVLQIYTLIIGVLVSLVVGVFAMLAIVGIGGLGVLVFIFYRILTRNK